MKLLDCSTVACSTYIFILYSCIVWKNEMILYIKMIDGQLRLPQSCMFFAKVDSSLSHFHPIIVVVFSSSISVQLLLSPTNFNVQLLLSNFYFKFVIKMNRIILFKSWSNGHKYLINSWIRVFRSIKFIENYHLPVQSFTLDFSPS